MIFFDIDGTLLDYDYAEKEGIIDFFRNHPLFSLNNSEAIETWKQLSKKYFGKFLANELSFQEQKRKRMQELFQMVGINLTDQDADEKFETYLRFYKENWKAYSDVKEALDRLQQKGFLLGIISNGDYQQQMEKLQRMGIAGYFSCVVTSSEAGAAKPDQSIFREACLRANRPIENCYYVGDRLDTDALGSKMAGMNGIWLNRFDKQKQANVVVIHSLSELLSVIS